MKRFLQKKAKLVFLCMLVLLTCTACANPRGKDGKTRADQIIASEETTIDVNQINISDITDKAEKKELKKQVKDGKITIPATTFKSSMSHGWFDGLIVWPIAQIINLVSAKTDAGVGIIVTTLLIQMLVFVFTRKSQMSTQRMQEIQPEIQKIQNKYKDKTDERSKMQMAQELQNIYQKYDIHPFGSMLITFIQLPIMMGMYYATMRSVSVVSGSFMGISLAGTPLDGFKAFDIAYISIYVLMVIFYIVSMKLPQWLKKWQDKKDNVKVKKYAQNDGNPMANSMNM